MTYRDENGCVSTHVPALGLILGIFCTAINHAGTTCKPSLLRSTDLAATKISDNRPNLKKNRQYTLYIYQIKACFKRYTMQQKSS